MKKHNRLMNLFKKSAAASLALVLAAVMMAASGMVSAKADDDDGLTEIHISTVDDLKELAKNCRLDSWSQDKKVILDKSIELNGEEFTAIPTFGGIFEGKGNTINGISITKDGSYQGLFRYVQEGAIVRNLTVKGNVLPGGTSSYVGGIVGSNKGLITNCKFAGVCNGKSNVGGIAGSNESEGTIYASIAEGVVYAEHYAGGIAGINVGIIDSSSNSANINTKIEQMDNIKIQDISLDTLTTTEDAVDITDIGGIAGYSSGKLYDNKNYGDVGYQHKGYNVGGIAGRQSGYIYGCANYGHIYGRKEVAGIAGQMEPYVNLTFTESTISQLRDKLDVLQNGIDKTINDARGYSDSVSDSLSRMSDYADTASSSADSLIDKTESMINADTDQVNNLSAVVTKAIDLLVPVTDDIKEASDNLKDSADILQDAADKAGNSSDDTQKVIEILSDALGYISINQDNIEKASDAIDKAIEALNDRDFDKASGYIKDANTALKDSVNGVNDALNKAREAEPYLKNIADNIKETLDKINNGMNELKDAGSALSDASSGLGDVTRYLSGNLNFKLEAIGSEQIQARENLMSSVDSMIDEMDGLNNTIRANNNTLADDFQHISDTLFDITDIIIDAREKSNEKADSDSDDRFDYDISADDEAGEADGKVEGCTNYADIEGDVNVGGIAGAMAVEHDLDPEDDIDIEGKLSTDFDYSTKAVIRSCTNRGRVTGKKDGTGGIAGEVDLGCIIECYGYGEIKSTGGNYVGGIAGSCKTLIRDSYAKCVLSGTDYIGGVAGSIKDVKNCNTLIKITDSDEYAGTIAGEVTGTAESNYFVSDDLAGIDGVSYSGKAEPVSYDELILSEDIPEEFKDFKLTFIANGDTVLVYDFEYGDSMPEEALPVIPVRDGYQAHWEDYDYSDLTFDGTINAVYDKYVTALESGQMRTDDRAMLLVEGRFTTEDAITVTKENNPDINGRNASECFTVNIPDDGQQEHLVHYILPEKVKNADIMILQNGTWNKTGTDTDGRYMTFTVSGSEVTFAAVKTASVLPTAIIAGIIFISVIILIMRCRKRRKKKKAIAE